MRKMRMSQESGQRYENYDADPDLRRAPVGENPSGGRGDDQRLCEIHGGSQVFLEEGEIQTVETLIKCIVIASGNDASVAMAEYVAGDEGAFVKQMNERAKGLGMNHTNFVDCCGLTDSPDHVTTARDIAVMSRELITKYPQITNYSTIWMENITHVTRQGSKEFGLANTNKLLKMAVDFEVTGLKTVPPAWQNTAFLLRQKRTEWN